MSHIFIIILINIIFLSETFSNDNINSEVSSLIEACDKGYHDEVINLIKRNISPNRQNKDGINCLMRASYNNHKDIILFLLENQININNQDFGGATALHIASRRGNIEIAKLLIKAGANIDLQDKSGFTALMKAISNNHIDIVKLLIENNANINLMDNMNYLAINYSFNKKYWEIAGEILKKTNLNLINIEQKNKLIHLAKTSNQNDILAILEEKLPDPEIFPIIKHDLFPIQVRDFIEDPTILDNEIYYLALGEYQSKDSLYEMIKKIKIYLDKDKNLGFYICNKNNIYKLRYGYYNSSEKIKIDCDKLKENKIICFIAKEKKSDISD